ncbi:hypothetical protein [Bifidobacterium dentium]|uniref:hypothetical protein n=1 Tax=Bifidobacterium dentium TaxID=1689 RepID=UPI003D185805
MAIVSMILKIILLLALFVGLMLPLKDVTAWDEAGWHLRLVVCAISTVFWTAWLLFSPKFTALVTVCVIWAILLLCSVHRPSLRNLLPFWRWLMALPHRIKGDSPEFIVERVLGLRPFEDSTTDFGGNRDYTARYAVDGDEKLLDFTCNLTGITDDFVNKKCRDGLGAMRAETYKVDHLGPRPLDAPLL